MSRYQFVSIVSLRLTPCCRRWNQDTDDWNWSNVGMAAIRQNYQTIFNRQSAGNFNHSGTIVLTHEL